MKNLIALLLVVFSFGTFVSIAQTNFKFDLAKADPLDSKSSLRAIEKIEIHTAYLNKAIADKSTTQQFYGLLYLYRDYYRDGNYVKATQNLLQADSIAQASGNVSWQAAMCLRKGTMADVAYNNLEVALKQFQMAHELCIKAKDSLCIGESLEEIANTYTFQKNYDKAEEYFKLSLPFLKKFADTARMASAYNNYSNLLAFQGRFSEADTYLNNAIAIVRANKNMYIEMMYSNNLASLYTDMGQYDNAIALYLNNVTINKLHNWSDRLKISYEGLSDAFEKKGDYGSALSYTDSCYFLKDSLTGREVQLKIAELNTKFQAQEKELSLKKNQLALVQAHEAITKRTFFIAFILILLTIGIIAWRLQSRKNKQVLKQNKENLNELTNILLQKNTLLTALEEQMSTRETTKIQLDETNGFENKLYNQRILTNDDWSAFKMSFEKAYPGYLLRLRTTYATLSEAEERLFLFIKLKLKSKEIASILGISVDTVKKTRNRLRKRLELAEEVDLEEHIITF